MSDETIFMLEADPRTKPKALPVWPNPSCRSEGAEPPLVLRFHSAVPNGIDLALGRIPQRDTATYLSAIREAGNRSICCEIDCAGGETRSALAITRALLAHPFRVTARIPGKCYSGAALIALAADRRMIAPCAHVWIHRARRIVTPEQFEKMKALSVDALRRMNDALNDADDEMAALLMARVSASEETARRWMAEACQWSAIEALELGIVDEIDEELLQ